MNRIIRITAIVMVVISSILLNSCRRSEVVYTHYENLPVRGWEADSVLAFHFAVEDTISPCDVVLSLRHFDTYPFQNVWLFTQLLHNEQVMASDTMEYYLADQRGQWLGNGFGSRKEMPMLYRQQFVFPRSGEYTLCVKHGMRTPRLTSVSDMGLIITQQ